MEELTMYDAIDVGAIPADAAAVAGYVGGNWPTYPQLLTKFPDAHHVSIAVNSGEDAHVLDIETGDAKPADAPAWVLRQQQRGLKRPGLYCSLSVMQGVVDALETHDVQRKSVVLWCAHYTGTPHILRTPVRRRTQGDSRRHPVQRNQQRRREPRHARVLAGALIDSTACPPSSCRGASLDPPKVVDGSTPGGETPRDSVDPG
ncbi:MAG: hypothetical protein QOF69_393 [Solirubrobacteraceae bacterium]|nr:hypothetical protein [Solirubrobacteraceae bacterium]